MLVFGSFTEDETKSILLGQSSKSAEKTSVKPPLQFGSLNLPVGSPLNGPDAKSRRNPSCKGILDTKPPQPAKKESQLQGLGGASDTHLGVSEKNGNVSNMNHFSSLSNGGNKIEVDHVISTSLKQLQTGDSSRDCSQRSIFHLLDGDGSDTAEDSLASVPTEETENTENGTLSSLEELLPRGLINSGNLCFLNSTLQALLSCSPFVQLLLELERRNIPKVFRSLPCLE